MSEYAVKKALKKYLKEIGAYCFMPVQMGYGAKTVDFLICHKGKFYGIETKTERVEDATLYQKLVMSAIIAAGGEAWVENSTGLEKTKSVLQP